MNIYQGFLKNIEVEDYEERRSRKTTENGRQEYKRKSQEPNYNCVDNTRVSTLRRLHQI